MNMLLTVLCNALYLAKYGVLADCSCAGEGCSCLISPDADNEANMGSNLFKLNSSAKSNSDKNDANNSSGLCWGSSKKETGQTEASKKAGEGTQETSKLSSSSPSGSSSVSASGLFGFGKGNEKQDSGSKNTKAKLFGSSKSSEKQSSGSKNTKSKLFGSSKSKPQKGKKGKSNLLKSSKNKKSKLVGDAAQSNLCAADAENSVQAFASPELSSNLTGSEGAQGEASCLVGGSENNSGLIYTDDPGYASHLAGEMDADQEGPMN